MRSTRAVSRNELSSCSRFSSGTRQLSRLINAFCTTRSAILFWLFSALNPGVVLFSTMNPFTWLSAKSRAQMIVTSPIVALPIHFFWPFSTHILPSRRAVVVNPPDVPDPTKGSVSPKEPIFSSLDIGGSHFFFCSSEPHKKIEPITRPLWTPKHVAQDQSTHAISIATKPARSVLPPAHPYPSYPRPAIFNSRIPGIRSKGKESSAQYLLITGATWDSMNPPTCPTLSPPACLTTSLSS